MSQLIYLRQRIRAIETIKKITHAMRLVAMSGHTRLRGKEQTFAFYQNSVDTLLGALNAYLPQTSLPSFLTPETTNPHNLIILVASQKGLCGNFNNAVFSVFEQEMNTIDPQMTNSYIALGKKAVDYFKTREVNLHGTFNNFTLKNLSAIAQSIIKIIISQPEPFTSVRIISNHQKTFFLQIPQVTYLLPLSLDNVPKESASLLDEYIWEQDPQEIFSRLIQLYLQSSLENLFLQSLLAEQAARFISMDKATRNAQEILDVMVLDYNKLRQAKITKELAELTGSLT